MLYVVLADMYSDGYVGIRKKILAQVKVFSGEFGDVYYTSYSGQMMYFMLNGKVLEKELALTRQQCFKLLLNWIEQYGITKTYIRYAYSDKWFIYFLKCLKDKDIVSVLEFPTIPYDAEINNKRIKIEDSYHREQLQRYISLCTTYSDYKEVFGVPCIPLLNGIDPEEHPVKKKRIVDGKIVLLAVATMNKWHGYERVIEGMAEYYAQKGTQQIIIRLVGRGVETDKYKVLTSKYNLEKNVEFYSYADGEELNKHYDEADIAIGTLGMYKINITKASPIKLAEYCIRGIPFIYAYEDEGFRGDENYVLKFLNDSTSLDMSKIIRFYNYLIGNKDFLHEMREYAFQKYSWEGILRPVVQYLKL